MILLTQVIRLQMPFIHTINWLLYAASTSVDYWLSDSIDGYLGQLTAMHSADELRGCPICRHGRPLRPPRLMPSHDSLDERGCF